MRVLVIEDEKSIAAEIAATLTNARYVVDVVHDGEEGWFRAETEDYEGIVLDLGLPRMTTEYRSSRGCAPRESEHPY